VLIQRLEQIGHALAMLSRNGHRLAKPKLISLVKAVHALAAFHLVGDQDRLVPKTAHQPWQTQSLSGSARRAHQ
jgi:hypothetical protein